MASPSPAPSPGSPSPGGNAGSNYETVFTNYKAGMEGVDVDKVKRVVFEMSKDSAHFQNEQRKHQQTEERIARMRTAAAALTPAQLATKTAAADGRIAELEASRNLTRTWIHVDMDAFFAAVEELDNPSLQGRPFAVGGMGMISTASYRARQFGVRSAMPGFIAVKLCPELVFVAPNFEKYRAAAETTRTVFARFDPRFQAGSLDEAYLDVTSVCAERGVSGAHIAAEIRAAVKEATGGLTCSCGVAPNMMLAKVCSDRNKPDGQFVLAPTREAVTAFVSELPVRKVPGVGRVTEHVLRAFGVTMCSHVMEQRGLLLALFSPLSAEFFLHFALGLGDTEHSETPGVGEVGRKGMSCERTFKPLSGRADLEAKCAEIAAHLAADLAEEGLKGKTLTLKLKLTTFEVRTRALTLSHHIHTKDDILATALKLLRAELPVEIRLMGVRLSQFFEEPKRPPGQLSLESVLKRSRKKSAAAGQPSPQPSGGGGGILGAGKEGDEDADAVHTSQLLSPGDEVELTLRNWHQETTAAGDTFAPPPPPRMHLPPTLMDDLVQRGGRGAAATAEAISAGPSNAPAAPPQTWSCEACTFENKKGQLVCEMCGTSVAGRRWNVHEVGGGGTGQQLPSDKGRKKKRARGAAAPAGGPSILEFCKPQGGPVPKRERTE